MVTTVMDEPKMRVEMQRKYFKEKDYKVVEVPRSRLGELSHIWSLLPRIGYDEGKPQPSMIPVGFVKKEDEKWHLLGVVKHQDVLHHVPGSSDLFVEPLTGKLSITPKPQDDITRNMVEVLVARLPEPLKTKLYEAALKHADLGRDMFVKD